MRLIIWPYATLLAMSAFSAGGALLLLWSRKLETQARGPLMGAPAIWLASSFLYAVVPSEQVATWFSSPKHERGCFGAAPHPAAGALLTGGIL